MTLLAVDAGRSEVEYKSEMNMGAFPSSVAEAVELLDPAFVKGDLELEVDGSKWWVGRLAQVEGEGRERNNFGESKAHEILKIQVLASVIYAGLAGKTIDLGVLVPIKNFTDNEKSKIRSLLRGTHDVKYSLVKEYKKDPGVCETKIIINDRILISQEGSAAYWSDPRQEDTQVLDFGAKTINYAYYNYHEGQSVFVNRKSYTEETGWEVIKHDYGLTHKKDEKLEPHEIDKMAGDLAKKAIEAVDRVKWSPDNVTQVFGGVAAHVFPYIKKKFPRAYIPNDPRNGNVIGLFNALEEVHLHA
jgi:plasmid segregation protein ParM